MQLYLALGDSITVGYGVGRVNAFPTLYAEFLQSVTPTLQMLNYGASGLTTGGMLSMLQSDLKLRTSIAQATLVTITIGSNDLILLLRNGNFQLRSASVALMLSTLRKNLFQIGTEIRRLNPAATIKTATIYNPLPAGPYAQHTRLAQRIIDQANENIIAWTQSFGFEVVFLDRVFRGKEKLLIGPDFIHPSVIGHQHIAGAFIYTQLKEKPFLTRMDR